MNFIGGESFKAELIKNVRKQFNTEKEFIDKELKIWYNINTREIKQQLYNDKKESDKFFKWIYLSYILRYGVKVACMALTHEIPVRVEDTSATNVRRRQQWDNLIKTINFY